MNANGIPTGTIWPGDDGRNVVVIDQTRLPHAFETLDLVTLEDALARNLAFDVTPARLVTGIITERGVSEASEEGLVSLFPDMT